jgi:N6-adenosine-specific RNA methylase IME4
MPLEAIGLVKSYGFELKTMTCFSWIKQTKNRKDHFGMGFYSRQQQEHCLIARRGKPKILSHSVRQNIRAPIREHSRKPDEVRNRIVELCGNVPRLEMFARPPLVKGWDVWGNAVENDAVISVVSIQNLFARRT